MCSQKKVLGNDPSSAAQAVCWEDGNWKENVFIFTAEDLFFEKPYKNVLSGDLMLLTSTRKPRVIIKYVGLGL